MFWLKGCNRCNGDMVRDREDWQCLQCGRYYYGAMPWSHLFRGDSSWQGGNKVSRRKGGFRKKAVRKEVH